VVTRILYALLLVMVVWSFLILNHLIPLKGVPFHDGTYNEFHGAQFELANKIKEKIKDKNLLIMDSDGSNLVGNMGVPAIYTRYYLSQNNVGGQYSNRRDPIGYMKRIDPDYVLIESYNKVLIDYFKIKRTNVPALIKVKGVSKNTFEVTEL
jgi:hypothetical protein